VESHNAKEGAKFQMKLYERFASKTFE
jgi:C1A family cysteine protease